MSTGLRFTLEVDGLPPDAFAVVSFHLNQSLSSLFSLDLSLVSQQFLSLEFAQVLDKMAYLTIWQGDEVQRRVKGVVTWFELGENDKNQMLYSMKVHPPLWRAGLRQNFRIFQNEDIKSILGTMLQENGVTEWSPLFSEPHPSREFCVQYGETDYDFLCRMACGEPDGVAVAAAASAGMTGGSALHLADIDKRGAVDTFGCSIECRPLFLVHVKVNGGLPGQHAEKTVDGAQVHAPDAFAISVQIAGRQREHGRDAKQDQCGMDMVLESGGLSVQCGKRQHDAWPAFPAYPARDRAFFAVPADEFGQCAVRLDHAVFDIRDRGDVLLAQGLDDLVGRQAQLTQLFDIQPAAADDDGGLPVEQPPEQAAFERGKAEQDLERDERRDRHQTGQHRDAGVLHGDGGEIGYQNGDRELGRVELAQLPLAHQAHGGDHSGVEQQGAQQGNSHISTSFGCRFTHSIAGSRRNMPHTGI